VAVVTGSIYRKRKESIPGKLEIRCHKLLAVQRWRCRSKSNISVDKLSSNKIVSRKAIGPKTPKPSEAIPAGGASALALMAVGMPKACSVRGPR
jgi:hypothetical protein